MSDVYLADELEEELERTARSARKPPERPEKNKAHILKENTRHPKPMKIDTI